MTTTVDEAPGTPVAIGGTRGGPDKPTLRQDTWWVEPVVTVTILTAFVVYSTWAAFVGKDYFAGRYVHGVEVNRNLISPFYSPCLTGSCVPGSHPFGVWIAAWHITPALLILIFPLGFRLTCYYYRKAYYRSFWWSPPANPVWASASAWAPSSSVSMPRSSGSTASRATPAATSAGGRCGRSPNTRSATRCGSWSRR